MNLNDYPTPETDKLEAHWTSLQGTRAAFRAVLASHLQLEREAAAWRDVATRLATEMRELAWLAGQAGSVQPNNAELALEAFDRLLAETNKTSENNEH